ncbi:MAG: histidine kinase [Peptococcaceae bacterium]|nr:histidine kinase [Peptococcaceae bacterium]
MFDGGWRRQIYYIASALLILAGIISFAASAQRAYVGLDIERVQRQWLVVYSDPSGEGYRAGVRAGDEILKIDGEDAGRYRLAQKWGGAEGAASLEFRAPGQDAVRQIVIQPPSIVLTLFGNVPVYVLGLIFWLLGFMTWIKRPFRKQVRTLFWLNWAVAMAFIFVKPSSRCLFLGRELEYLTLSLVPILLVAFISIFPVKNENRINRFSWYVLRCLYIGIFCLTFLEFFDLLHLESFLRKLVLSHVLLGIAVTLWNLALLLRKPRDSKERNQAGIVLLGMAAGFLPISLLTTLSLLFEVRQWLYAQISSLFLILIPVSLYYVLVHKYLPDSRRILSYIMSCFLAGISGFILVYVLFFSQVLQKAGLKPYLILLFLAVLFTICFYGARLLADKFFIRRHPVQLKVWELNKKMGVLEGENSLLEEMVSALGIEGAFFIVKQPQAGTYKKGVGRFLENAEEQAALEAYFQSGHRTEIGALSLPEDAPAEVYIPFILHDYSCGIFIGHRVSHIRFEREELPLLTLLATQLAYQIIMSLMIGELSRGACQAEREKLRLSNLSASLFDRLEEERRSLANEIDEGPLKRAMTLKSCTEYLLKHPEPEIAATVLANMKDAVFDLNYELRLMSRRLRPVSLKSMGLLAAVDLLCRELMLRSRTVITLETEGITYDDRFREDIELTVYRFIEESLARAAGDSEPDSHLIRIERRESELYLFVSDNGREPDPVRLEKETAGEEAVETDGMRERVKRLKGVLSIQAAPRQGRELRVVIPLTGASGLPFAEKHCFGEKQHLLEKKNNDEQGAVHVSVCGRD